MIIVNFPHNPTGYLPSQSDLNAIVEIARKQGITLFSDEMYRFLTHNPEDEVSSVCDIYENAVSLWGTAKTFGLAGLRLGFLTSQNQDILNKVEAFKDYLSICSSAPSEILATIAMNNITKFTEPNIEKIKKNIALFKQFSERNQGFLEFIEPNAGSTAFVKLNIEESSMAYAERLVQDTGIMLLPAETFEYGTKHARIGFGRQNLAEILRVFEAYINKTIK